MPAEWDDRPGDGDDDAGVFDGHAHLDAETGEGEHLGEADEPGAGADLPKPPEPQDPPEPEPASPDAPLSPEEPPLEDFEEGGAQDEPIAPDGGYEPTEAGAEGGFDDVDIDVDDGDEPDLQDVGPETETELEPEFREELEVPPPAPDTVEHAFVAEEADAAFDEQALDEDMQPQAHEPASPEVPEAPEAPEAATTPEPVQEAADAPTVVAEAYAPYDGPPLTPAEGGMPAGMQPPPGFVAGADAPDEHPPRPHLFLRFVLAALIIVSVFAGATSVTILNWFSDVAGALGHGAALAGVKDQLQSVESSKPETILIIGSDKRYGEGDRGRSDTTILLRLDPNREAISLLSIPRDLKVKIPHHGTDKFNAAYSDGGPRLTLQVVKNLTGIHVNHLVNVDFSGFFYAINAIGCVFVDVDHRYFHSNAGLPPSLQYSEIDIQPGYQRLCGKTALQYVRYRHQDNDLVRSARQHDFLREARQKVGPSKLIGDRKQLIRIFTRYTS
ncbi:MAG: polyisoprenyl-teichoic acid--peptidoglycan teichoic acid transferase, partial [Solirubrobacterales bacterium]|nr:polyisoprenyl-teichoic acid--peptidoglycan teichoic acid transferase [Solirubrobacterales bacterium]